LCPSISFERLGDDLAFNRQPWPFARVQDNDFANALEFGVDPITHVIITDAVGVALPSRWLGGADSRYLIIKEFSEAENVGGLDEEFC
jgi:hypothetical protein